MALDYSLIMFERARVLPVQEIRQLLIQRFALEEYSDWIGLGGEGLTASVISTDEEEAAELGFAYPGVNVGFRIDKFDLHDAGMTNMLHMVDELLRRADVEANFYFDEGPDHKYLVKAKGTVTLKRCDFWEYGENQYRALIALPYEYCKTSVHFNLTFLGPNRKVNLMALANLLMVKFQLSVHPKYATQRIGEGLIVTPYRFEDKGPYCFVSPKEEGEFLGVHFEVNVFSYDFGLAKLVAITRWVLEQYAGDATLEWYPESMVHASLLTRTNNEIALSDEPDFWTQERKAIFLDKP